MSLHCAVDGPLSDCHAQTCQPCLGFHLRSTNTATQVYSKISMFAHVLAPALSQKQTVSSSSLCVCVSGCGYLLLWIIYDIPTEQERAMRSLHEKQLSGTFLVSPILIQLHCFKSALLNSNRPRCTCIQNHAISHHPCLDLTPSLIKPIRFRRMVHAIRLLGWVSFLPLVSTLQDV